MSVEIGCDRVVIRCGVVWWCEIVMINMIHRHQVRRSWGLPYNGIGITNGANT